jgi:replication factor A1
MTLFTSVGHRVGNPAQINADGSVDQNKQAPPAPVATGGVKRAAPDDAELPQNKRPLANSTSVNTPRSSILENRFSATQSTPFDPSSANVFPISSLTPYQNRWTIKVRVTHKSDIRRWSNSKGEGHLFSMDLLDESGEIRATAFKEQCDKYYNTIEVGKVEMLLISYE